MEIKELAELRGLKEEWRNIELRATNYIQKIPESIPPGSNFHIEVRCLEEDYKELRSRTSAILKSFGIKEEFLPRDIPLPEYVYGTISDLPVVYRSLTNVFLWRINKECAKVINLIDGLTTTVALTEEKEKELKSLEDKIKEEIEPVLPLFSHDLIESVKCFRNGEFLGSVLICGRIIEFLIEKVGSQVSNNSKAEPKQKSDAFYDFLKNKKVIDDDEGKKILEAIKSYRNKYSHDIKLYPDLEESLIILSGVTSLISKVAKNKEEFSFLLSV
jgi:hypothetical protein